MSQTSELFAAYTAELNTVLNRGDLPELSNIVEVLSKAFFRRNTVFVAGNGGSAATASHMMADLQKTTLGKEHHLPHRLKTIALTDNVPLMTAWGNDAHYNTIFAEQLRSLGDPGDILLVITGSGNSPNILAALNAARSMGVTTVGFLGFDGGQARALCDHAIVVPSTNYGIVEDAHSIFMHMITAALKETVQAGLI